MKGSVVIVRELYFKLMADMYVFRLPEYEHMIPGMSCVCHVCIHVNLDVRLLSPQWLKGFQFNSVFKPLSIIGRCSQSMDILAQKYGSFRLILRSIFSRTRL
jgi:hypothetical protein